ncbi:hypothetical protein CPB83DRAFT_884597 [Crepidotus variabilis]|uniref:Uncharacterized protein n=1 Tax=Crepidotus variabilis TaxID=179855 RepID=A0A9P6JMZ8_9AGAR|nr:hypothetical protein CPB83DRAFT_884597 [Crepidotus variabilis]
MSARQNKKQRKGRNNANNRERTVTTLTGDPDVPFPVPTVSEEAVPQPVGVLAMPATFPGTSAGNNIQNVVMGPQPYAMTASYNNGFGFNGSFGPAMSNIHQQQQPHPFLPAASSSTMPPHQVQKPPLPPGQNDLEILQNLKKIILENQHPFFRAVPQPAALAALYKGPLTASSQTSIDVQSEERSGSGNPEAPSDGNAVPPPVSGSSDTSSADAPRSKVEESEKDPKPLKPLGLQDQLSTVNQLDRYENSSGSNVGSSLVEMTPIEKPDLIPSNASESRSAEPPAPENAAHEKYDPHLPALWDSVKTEPVDDPMEGRDPSYANNGDLQQTESWNPYGSYSENGTSDLDRKPGLPATPTSNMNNRPSGGNDRGPNNNPRGSGWQDRNRRQSYDRLHDNRQNPPRRQSSNAEGHYDGPNGRRGQGDDFGPRRPPGDARRTNGSLGRYPSMSDTPNDSRPPDDLRARPASRVPLISRIETDEAMAMGNNSSLSTQAMEPPSVVPVPSAILNHPAVSDNQAQLDRTNIPSRQSTGDITSLPPGESGPHQRNFQNHKKRFNNRNQQSGGPNHGPPYNNNPGGQRYEPPRPGYGRPPSPGPPPHSGNSFRGRSASTEGRGARVPPSPSRGGRDYRGPPNRAVSRDRGASTYRPDYDSDIPPRYGDSRPPHSRDFSLPPGGDRGRPGAYSPPRPGNTSARDWDFGAYQNRREWNGTEDNTYKPRGNWENAPPGDRERYDRDYQPRPAGWEARGDREYPARDTYPANIAPPPDDRFVDRSRPAPQSGYPNYNNRRQRSASPPRRTGSGIVDDRPPLKRPREDYPPGDFYQPPPQWSSR